MADNELRKAKQFRLRPLLAFVTVAGLDLATILANYRQPACLASVFIVQVVLTLICLGLYWRVHSYARWDPRHADRGLFNGFLSSALSYGGMLVALITASSSRAASGNLVEFTILSIVVIVFAGSLITGTAGGITWLIAYGFFYKAIKQYSHQTQGAMLGAVVGMVAPTAGTLYFRIPMEFGLRWIPVGVILPAIVFATITPIYITHLDRPA